LAVAKIVVHYHCASKHQTVVPALREALFRWFGAPLDTTVSVAGRLS
jgi:hypothetical protein